MDRVLVQLKQQPLPPDVPSLALECNWDHLLNEMDNLLKQLGFLSFSYNVSVRPLKNATVEPKSFLCEQFGELASSVPLSVKEAYYHDVAQHDAVWDNIPSAQEPLLLSQVNTSHTADTFWKKQGVNSRVCIPMKGTHDNYWFQYFTLYHKLPMSEFSGHFEKIKEWLVPILTRYHELLQATATQEQNPFLIKKVLSQTCVEVIRLTSEGLAVKSIADKLALTEEGITYHITRAKKILGAKNKAHLIAIIFQIGLL